MYVSQQPEDFYGNIGDTVSFHVVARGTNLSYQWQVSTDGGTIWHDSTAAGSTTDTVTNVVALSKVGYLYRCRVTKSNGAYATSKAVAIRVPEIKISQQPVNVYLTGGQTGTVSVTVADDTNVTYKWQVSNDGGKNWQNSTSPGNATSAMTVTGAEYRVGFLYRCKLTDSNGTVQYTQPARMCRKSTTWNYTYNGGLRTQRTSGTDTYEYIYSGSQLVNMTRNGEELYFSYTATGAPMSVIYQDTAYIYATNLQGDVVAILNSAGTAVVQYTYDAWGNILSISGSMAANLGMYNPLRYRGYVYDWETGLYYLQSRYYDPEMGRFINGDGFTATGQGFAGNNMFAYCGNNPVTNSDYSGTRYCAATTIAGETKKQRQQAFKHQNKIARDAAFRVVYAEELAVLEGNTNIYKGVRVHKILPGSAGFSYGDIYLPANASNTKEGIMHLRHEYGHTIQLNKLGIWDYTTLVFLPSVTFFYIDELTQVNISYYSLPWEFEANVLGNVTYKYYDSSYAYFYMSYIDFVSRVTGNKMNYPTPIEL